MNGGYMKNHNVPLPKTIDYNDPKTDNHMLNPVSIMAFQEMNLRQMIEDINSEDKANGGKNQYHIV